MSVKPFHLGWFIHGPSPMGWGTPFSGNIGNGWRSPELLVDLVRAAERACMDYVLLEDGPYIADAYADSNEIYLRNAMKVPLLDPVIVSTILLRETSRIGVCATLPTYGMHPYLLARLLGSMDSISGGRAGWNMVTGNSPRSAQNWGMDALADHGMRYEMADEFMAAAKALWDTWEPDAVINDLEGKSFADPAKVHRADFTGEWFSTRGPLNSGPLPQGRPVIAQAGGSPRGRQFAAQHADTIVGTGLTIEQMRNYRDDVRARAQASGRNPDDIKVMFLINPIIGATRQEAQDRIDARIAEVEADPGPALASLSSLGSFDLSTYSLDDKLDPSQFTITGSTTTISQFFEQNQGKTLREVAVRRATASLGAHGLIGPPDEIADRLGLLAEEIGGDGFLVGNADVTRRMIAEVCDGLVPELQKRGLTRTAYSHSMLRDNLRDF